MKFIPLAGTLEAAALEAGYKAGREIGVVRLGGCCLFFRNKLKTYYIPYSDITRCFRRVVLIPAQMCCGKGDFEMEHLVVCTGEGEVAQIQLPGTRAGKILLEEVARLAPHIAIGKPGE